LASDCGALVNVTYFLAGNYSNYNLLDCSEVFLKTGHVYAFSIGQINSDYGCYSLLYLLDGKRFVICIRSNKFTQICKHIMNFKEGIFRQLRIFKTTNHQFSQLIHLDVLSCQINDKLLSTNSSQSQQYRKEFRPDLFAYSQSVNALALCSQQALFVLRGF
jgi:hypothetical protein